MSKSLYNKYRPKNFDDLIGQEVAKKILINSIKQNKLNNSYLFYGIRGTGKTTIARIFAKALNCEQVDQNGNPCGKCSVCKSIDDASNLDVIEIDAASNNGVDEIRDIKEKIIYQTAGSKYKIYIIDEVHMLSKSAFNALLKTLEEPPERIIFLLVTTEINKIPDTILSRNIIINLATLTKDEIETGLIRILEAEGIVYQKEPLSYIELISGGALRDAISLLEKVLLFSKELTEENIIKSLGLIKNSSIISGLQNKEILIKLLNKQQLDIRKVVIQMIELLTQGILQDQMNDFQLLEDLILLSINIKDPQLLFLSIRGTLIKNLNKDKLKNQSEVLINPSVNVSNLPEKESSLLPTNSTTDNVEFSTNVNLEIVSANNSKKESTVQSTVPTLEKEKITDFVSAKHYLTIMFDSTQEMIDKYKKRYEYLNSYLNKNKWSKYVNVLQDSKILVAKKGYIMIGIQDENNYEIFKDYSLERELLLFLNELFGEKVFLLPVLPKTWEKLTKNFNSLKKKNNKISEQIFIPHIEEAKIEEYKKIFGDEIEIK